MQYVCHLQGCILSFDWHSLVDYYIFYCTISPQCIALAVAMHILCCHNSCECVCVIILVRVTQNHTPHKWSSEAIDRVEVPVRRVTLPGVTFCFSLHVNTGFPWLGFTQLDVQLRLVQLTCFCRQFETSMIIYVLYTEWMSTNLTLSTREVIVIIIATIILSSFALTLAIEIDNQRTSRKQLHVQSF